jgi:predicted nuclease of restriction endonuclease-like RecB superfamily
VLTADLVAVRRHKGELRVVALSDARRERALTIADHLVTAAASSVGSPREEVLAAFSRQQTHASERKLAKALEKLVLDRCEFEAESAIDPPTLRRRLFEEASRVRAGLGDGETFPRDGIVHAVAAEFKLTEEEFLRAAYADLKGSHKLLRFDVIEASQLVHRLHLAQVEAVLLRAVTVTVTVECKNPYELRDLFRALKFHRLLFRIERDGTRHKLVIDGPFSMFDAVTKYGLQLALAFRSIAACSSWHLEADVRWGKKRETLRFVASGQGTHVSGATPERAPSKAKSDDVAVLVDHMPDDVRALFLAVSSMDGPWDVVPAAVVIDVPGKGVIVPDLTFHHRPTKRLVHLEVLGFWSRDAVWKRIEWAESGLGVPVVFAFSSRLRVDESVVPDDASIALYSYRGTMNPKAVVDRLEKVLASAVEKRP